MSTFSSDRLRSKRSVAVVLILVVLAALAGGGYYLRPRLEAEPPRIAVAVDVDMLGVAPLEIQVTDQGTGLKSVSATLSQGVTVHSLASEQFDRPVNEKRIAVAVATLKGVREGPAVLRVEIGDAEMDAVMRVLRRKTMFRF